MPNPLKPTLLFKHYFQSDYISANGTLSCGLFGPDNDGYTVPKSRSSTSPVKCGSLSFL